MLKLSVMVTNENELMLEEDELVNNRKRPKFIAAYSPDEVFDAVTGEKDLEDPLAELINTSIAAFDLVRCSEEVNRSFKNAFNQLEKQFHFYKHMLSRC